MFLLTRPLRLFFCWWGLCLWPAHHSGGIAASLGVAILARMNLEDSKAAMVEGLKRIATPLFATVTFLFMSAMINQVGLVGVISAWIEPYIRFAPIQIMLLVSAVVGAVTQPNTASAAVVIPFLQILLRLSVDPVAASITAVGGCAIMQYDLTGGPVSSRPTVIPVIPGSELKAANKFQWPSMLAGLLATFLVTFLL